MGGVVKEPELRFCMEPGGEELGVMICARETGDVLRARGDTGVGRLLGVVGLIIFETRFLKDSVRAGEAECFGEGVLLEEWPELSIPFFSLPRMRLMKDFFFILPLPLERCRNSFPTRCPSVGSRFFLSLRMLVSSSGIVFTLRKGLCLSIISFMTCTCCSPVTDWPLICVTRQPFLSPASHAGPFLSIFCSKREGKGKSVNKTLKCRGNEPHIPEI